MPGCLPWTQPHSPLVRDVRLVDYKVRFLAPDAATGAKTRVLIEAASEEDRWSTIGVSQNIIEASAIALADALELPLARLAAPVFHRSAKDHPFLYCLDFVS